MVAPRCKHIHGPPQVFSTVGQVLVLDLAQVPDHIFTLWVFWILLNPSNQRIPVTCLVPVPIIVAGADYVLEIIAFFTRNPQQLALIVN